MICEALTQYNYFNVFLKKIRSKHSKCRLRF